MTGYFAQHPPRVRPDATVEANTADATLTVANFGKIQTNTGAGGTVVLTLPAVTSAAGCSIRVQITAAQIVQLKPAATEKVYLGGSGVVGKYCQIAGTIGNYIEVFCDGVSYLVLGYSGVATKEA
jgi:hypothetical protein